MTSPFDELIARSAEHSEREAGLPGRADPAPCKGCAQAVVRQSVGWHGACGVPVVRYGCTGDPDACPYNGEERKEGGTGIPPGTPGHSDGGGV